MKTIEVVVSPKGEVKVQTKGYSGSDCIEASREFEQAIGAKQTEVQTSEFFHQSTSAEQTTQQQSS